MQWTIARAATVCGKCGSPIPEGDPLFLVGIAALKRCLPCARAAGHKPNEAQIEAERKRIAAASPNAGGRAWWEE